MNILGIIDYSGNVVVKYDCSAYGEEISCTDNSGIGLGKLNKFKYKGYYYIDEISLFYVTSRFYNPKLGRFISPDATKYLSPYDLNGLNLFAYCFNDPVNMVDPSGHFAFSLFLAISWGIAIGMAVGFGIAAYCDSEDNGQIDGSVGLETYVTSVGLCGIVGGLTGGLLPSIAGGIALGDGSFAISGAGTLAGTSAIALSQQAVLVTAGVLGAAGILGATIAFAKGFGPRLGHNQYEKKMWNEAMRRLGINDKDLIKRLHNEIHKYPYADKLNKLLEILKEILRKLGYLYEK